MLPRTDMVCWWWILVVAGMMLWDIRLDEDMPRCLFERSMESECFCVLDIRIYNIKLLII